MDLTELHATCKYFEYEVQGERTDVCLSGVGKQFRRIARLRIELENNFFVFSPIGYKDRVTTSFHLNYNFAFDLGHFVHQKFQYFQVFPFNNNRNDDWYITPLGVREINSLAVNKLGNVSRFFFGYNTKTVQYVDIPVFHLSEVCQFIAKGAMERIL